MPFLFTGCYLIIELSDEGPRSDLKQLLHSVPKRLKLSFSQNENHLVGIVEFIHRSTDVTDPIGHCVAIAHRRDDSWVIYDDTKDREKVLTKKYEASIEILLYVRR